MSRLHISKGRSVEPILLNGTPAKRISTFLIPGGVDQSPSRLVGNPFCSEGSKIYGQGFVFDDEDAKANPDSLRRELIECDPKSASRIFPYMGGEDINGSPTLTPQRSVIFLSDLKSESDLVSWPRLTEIVRTKVKPEREKLGDNPVNTPLKGVGGHIKLTAQKLITISREITGPRELNCDHPLSFRVWSTDFIYAHTLCLFDLQEYSYFSVLQSRLHEVWARFLSSTLGDALRYTASDCFETFPFPEQVHGNESLELVGAAYYDLRSALMARSNEGLTKIYNRFHRPDERSPDILNLRNLHAAMDRAVLDAYGWIDIQPTCEFFPEFDDDEDEEEGGHPVRARQKFRYRWSDMVHDEVIARLLALNAERAHYRIFQRSKRRRMQVLPPQNAVKLLRPPKQN